ncbi:MAG: GWxTD domain-containing protein [bacterium]|nr:MAG: GWxTD domain-containing protein [bacterium]
MRRVFPLAIWALGLLFWGGVCTGEALQGQGDFEFFIDVVSLPSSDSTSLEIFQIAIPTKEIEYKKKDDTFTAMLRFKLMLRNEEETVYKRTFEVRDRKSSAPVATDISNFLFVVDSCLVQPGLYKLDLRIEDIQRKKRTLIGLLGGKFLASELKDAYIRIPDFSKEGLILSEPFFIWSRSANGAIIPNPMRIYGLKNDTLSFFVDVRSSQPAGDSLNLYFSIIDASGETRVQKDVTALLGEGGARVFGNFDVNTFPAGTYGIFVEAIESGGSFKSVQKDFSVAWELMNWQKPQRDLLVEARILFKDNEFTEFKRASLGEQEKMLSMYWKSVDPTPQTATNELYNEFLRRLWYADRNFSGFTRGALSDRGLIYMRFGPPDDIVHQRVPINRNDLEEAVEKLEDEYDIIIYSISDQSSFDPTTTLPRRMLHGQRTVRGTEGMDTGAYELWIYNHKGDPIFERDRLMTIKAGQRFLFIDLDGYGEYHMVGTSDEY